MSERPNMALFAAASKHFVKSAGHATLHSVPDLNSADRFKPLCLVKRKKSFWIWKKPKIIPTMITLNDIMEKPVDVTNLITSSTVIEEYKDTPSFNVDGDIGAKIASELDIDLSMTDKFSLSVNFGDIVKTEVKWQPLEKSLASVKINPSHALFKEIAKSKRTSVCVVLEAVACKGKGPLQEESDMKETGKASAKIPKITTVSVEVHSQEGVETKSHHQYTIPAGTIIAFSCTKLEIDENGIIRMHVGVDKVDNIDPVQDVKPSIEQIGDKIKEELKPLVSSNKFQEIKTALMEIIKTPKCLDNLLEVVSTASCSIEEKTKLSLSADIMSKEMYGADGWKTFLELLGFTIPESFTAESKIELPTEDPNGLIHACWPLVEAAADLSEKEITLFANCSSRNGKMLLETLSNAMIGKDTPYSEISTLMETDTNEKGFLLGLGFQVVEKSDGKCLRYKWNTHSAARDAFTLIG